MLRYRLKLEPDDNGTILVTSPDLPIVTFGDDETSATRNARDAAETILASMIEGRDDIPVPKFTDEVGVAYLILPLQTELKVQLHRAMREAGLTRADLQRKLGWQRESVDRLFRLDHKSRIEQLEQAFKATGKSVDIQIRAAA